MPERITMVAGRGRRVVIEPHAQHLLQAAGRTSADVVTYCEQVLRAEPLEDPTSDAFLLYEVGQEDCVAIHLGPKRLFVTTPEDAEPRTLAQAP